MNSLRNKFSLLAFLLIVSCSDKQEKPFPFTIRHDYDANSNILIYLVNPVNCENCLSLDREFFRDLMNCKRISRKNIVLVLPYKRPIEIPVLLENLMGDNWKNYQKNIISSDSVSDEIIKMNGLSELTSYLMIFNSKGDSILYKTEISHIDYDYVLKRYL